MFSLRVPESMESLPSRRFFLDDAPVASPGTPVEWAQAAIDNAAGKTFVVISTPRGVLRFLQGSRNFERWTGLVHSECVIGVYQDPDVRALAEDIRSAFYGRAKLATRHGLHAGSEAAYARAYYARNKERIKAQKRARRGKA